MHMYVRAFIAAPILLGISALTPANSGVDRLNYAVSGTFNDGGTFLGTFGYDPVANTYVTNGFDFGLFNITTTLGSDKISDQYASGGPPPDGYDDISSTPTLLSVLGGGHFENYSLDLDWKTPLNAAGGGILQPITGGDESFNNFSGSGPASITRNVQSGTVQLLPAHSSLYATGLNGPRGLRFASNGDLYVAEAGTGGGTSTVGECAQVPPPVGPYTGGLSARVSKISRSGQRTTVAQGFPSTKDAQGDLMGVADVAFLGNELFALVAGGGCSHGHTGYETGIAKVDLTTGRYTMVADLGAYLKSHPAKFVNQGDFEPDGVPYSLIAQDGKLYTVEPNHGQVFSVTAEGQISQYIDISESEGHAVPTSIAAWKGGFVVGLLNLFPIVPQSARVLTISSEADGLPLPTGFATPGARVIDSKAGFTTIVAVQFGPDGLLYVLELSAEAGFPTRGAGEVVRVNKAGVIETVVTGLDLPSGMTFGPDGALYISDLGAVPLGAAPQGSGEILRVTVQPGK